jgi:YVTN family beta-propeller protein
MQRILLSKGALFAVLAGAIIALAGCSGGSGAHIVNDPPAPTANAPAPTITNVSPNSGLAGTAAFTFTVSGTNFVSASVVNFGGVSRTTTFVSATQLTAAIPASAIASGGTAAVSVTNPAPGGTSNVVSFTIFNNQPTISSIAPVSAQAGSAAFTLTINGTNFVPSSVVNFGTIVPAMTFVSATQLTAAIPAMAIATNGVAGVTVVNPTPGGGISNAVNFTATGGTNPVPTIAYLNRSCATVGSSLNLMVYGSNFVSGSVVRWNGNDRPTAIANGPVLTAQILASDLAAAGTAAVTVFNPAPGGGSSNPLTFRIGARGIKPNSIAIDPSGQFAYVANEFWDCPDLADGNVSMYTIDTTTGVLTALGSPLDTNDEGAISLAVDPSGKFAYVANWGEGDTPGSISAYAIDGTTGALTSTGMTNGACPGLCAPWSVALAPSGKFAYAADEGGFAPTALSVFSIDATTGGLTSAGTVGAAGRAVSVAVDPLGRFVYLVNGSNGSPGQDDVISMYTITGVAGALSPIGTIAAGSSPGAIAIDPPGKFAYVANSGSNNISMFTIDNATGVLTSIGLITAGTKPVSLALDPTGKFAYVANSGSNDVSMYTIDSNTGALTLTGTIAAGSLPSCVVVHPSGKFAYVTNSGSNDISIYSIDSTQGGLTLIATTGT